MMAGTTARLLAAIMLAIGLILGGAPALAQSTTTYTYDALGRLTSSVNSNGAQSSYDYDPASNRTQLSGNGGSISVGNVSLTIAMNTPGSVTLTPSGNYTSLAVASSPSNGAASISGVTATYTPASGYVGSDSFTYTATGPSGTSAPGTVSVTVTSSSSAPVAGPVSVTVATNSNNNMISLNLSGGAATSVTIASAPSNGTTSAAGTNITYSPNGSYTGSDSFTYTATGPGGTSAPATVSVTVSQPTSAPVAGPVSATVAYESSNPIKLNLSGGAPTSVAVNSAIHGTSQSAGTSVYYIAPSGYAGSDSFTYAAYNQIGSSGNATVSITITAPALPVAGGGSDKVYLNSSNNPIPLNLSGGVADSVAVASPPINGTTTVSGTSITYTPNNGYTGPDSFTYTATNASGTSAPGTITLTVAVPPPVAGNVNVAVPYNATSYPIPLNLSGGVATSVAVVGMVQHGTATASGTTITYTPPSGYTGTDRFNYSATNAGGTSRAATVNISIPAAPVAGAVSATVAYNSTNNPLTLNLSGGAASSVAVASAPSNGTATASGTGITYTPTNGYYGSDSFTYSASNISGTSTAATVTITVNPPPPVAGAVSASVPYNSTNTPIPLSLSGGTATSVSVPTGGPNHSGPQHGTVSVTGITVTYTPTSGYIGSDSFTYTASNAGGTSASATVSITVLPPPPIAGPVSATVGYNSIGATITPNLSGGAATSVTAVTQPANGTITAAGTTFTYIPTSGYIGSDSFTYTASNTGGTSNTATVTITVNPPPPVAGAVSASVPYNSTNTPISLNLSGGTATSVYVPTGGPNHSGPQHGTVGVTGVTVTYTPTAGYMGSDSFTYTASNAGGTSASATVSITVLPQAPIAGATSTIIAYNATGATITLNLSGGTATSVAVASTPAHGTATASGTSISYTPTSGYIGSDSFTYTAANTGGTSAPATATITVMPPPPVAANSSANVPYNTATAVPLGLSGGAATSVSVITNGPNHNGPNHGTVSVSGTTVTYTPTSGYTGADTFNYYASNAAGSSAIATLSITVLPQPPIANASSATIAQNAGFTPITLSLTGGTATSVAVSTGPTNGIASASGTSISYEPNSGYLGSDTFAYTASNAGGTSAPATISITVRVPPPIAGNVSATVAENSSNNPITLSLSGGPATSVTVATAPRNGTATASGTTITYTPKPRQIGTDSFQYNASNASGTSSNATVSITISH